MTPLSEARAGERLGKAELGASPYSSLSWDVMPYSKTGRTCMPRRRLSRQSTAVTPRVHPVVLQKRHVLPILLKDDESEIYRGPRKDWTAPLNARPMGSTSLLEQAGAR